ncbi:hypothetical protein OROGR_015784 [Orobanche gracilis]
MDALEQVPNYAKFLKDVMSKKQRLGDYETMMLTEENSAVIYCKLPQKLKDPRSFTVPCTIGNFSFKRALCDLGASINLMPLSIFRKLGVSEIKATSITLQLAVCSLAYPKGVVEDVLVKVDKFIFSANFVVLDMDEDGDLPIILGCPFLATGKALINVEKETSRKEKFKKLEKGMLDDTTVSGEGHGPCQEQVAKGENVLSNDMTSDTVVSPIVSNDMVMSAVVSEESDHVGSQISKDLYP